VHERLLPNLGGDPKGQQQGEGAAMRFPNKAGSHADTDDVLTAELEAAGITVRRMEVFRNRPGEVKTSVLGEFVD
jgi:uroporphyrinogen-III synthase